ncbi:MAG TPA: protein-glutamate O-methyltransferase CheR [Bacteroidales bacterium]|nr:protein-glutamate O-methyltransferase CheR [Bacteroidales bacterium]
MSNAISETERTRNEDLEIRLLLEAVFQKYGYDFRNYSGAYLKRRLISRMRRSGLHSVSEMLYKVLYDSEFFSTLLLDLSLNVTEMFRDPRFFRAVREKIIPLLRTYPFLKIWHAGCSSGEEVYSMAIVLREEGLLERSLIYATDFNQAVVQKASDAIYPLDKMKEYADNYYKSGGKALFQDYFTISYDSVMVDQSLKKSIVFSDHNLVSDGVFGEMNMIVCRNVLIYFNRDLQNRVFGLFFNSLIPGGVLCLGTKETMMFSTHSDNYKQLHKLNIFTKLYASK